jgi:SAM-dependent methyltransferase
MAMEVLQAKAEIAEARKQLKVLGADAADAAVIARLKRNRLWPGNPLGDQVKSWDVWKTVSFLHRNLPPAAAVLDLGAYCCEILPALHRLGFAALTGVDLNPALTAMPHSDTINYLVGDFLGTSLADGSFDAVTAISVIEHGYQPDRLFSEVARLLKPGGYFLASIDYWPQKIDTANIRVFGLDWLIFSQQDVEQLFAVAAEHGLEPVGEINFAAGEPLISWQSRDYTFAWVALRKR